jgi:hypothetical protein
MATKKPTKKTPKKPAKKNGKNKIAKLRSDDGSRLRRLTRWQRAKNEKQQQRTTKLPSAWVLLGQSLRRLYRQKRLFLGILIVYALLYILFVKGITANFQLNTLRQELTTTFEGKLNGFSTGVALYGLLLGTATNGASDTASTYQTVLVVIISLALIWALRYGDYAKARIRESFYKGMYPLVPFVAVGLVLLLQALPALIVSSLFSTIQNSGLAVGALQQLIAIIILALGLFWSLYMLSSSLFALYIVTLPDAYPRAALKAARKLVRFRRIAILRKVLFLPVILLLASAIILIPLIIFVAPAAEILFMIFTILVLSIVHSYFYTLYRSLL